MKINEYPPIEIVEDDDFLILDTSGGTKKIAAKKLSDFVKVETYIPWVAHRNVFRGKNLGSEFTEEQKEAIRNNTFDDLYVGDYWEINGFRWRIADINYWLNTGNTPPYIGLTTPHLVIVPDSTLIEDNIPMNSTDTTNGGYVNSLMYKTNINKVKQIVFSAFDEKNVLNHSELFTNSTKDGYATGVTWVNSTVEIPNQNMIYGSGIYPQANGANVAFYYTLDKTQLSLFRLRPDLITLSTNYWLRDIISESAFAVVSWFGGAGDGLASETSRGVRPVFGLIG